MSAETSAEWSGAFFYGILSFLFIAMVCIAYLLVWVSKKDKSKKLGTMGGFPCKGGLPECDKNIFFIVFHHSGHHDKILSLPRLYNKQN